MDRDLERISALLFSIDRNLVVAVLHKRDIESLAKTKHAEVDYESQQGSYS